MDFKYRGTVCSDLNLIKNFVEEVLNNLNNIINNNDLMFDIKLILNELVINGALHGNKCIQNKLVTLSLDIDNNTIKIQVEDEGCGVEYDFNSYDSTDLKCCGRGLILVQGLSDELYIYNNKVISIKHISKYF